MPAKTAPYGTWVSPLTMDALMEGRRLTHLVSDGEDWYWAEARPDDGGRVVVVRRLADGTEQDITPAPFNVRTRVHEYGGQAYWVRNRMVWFVNFQDQRIYCQAQGGAPVPVTQAGDVRYADLTYDEGRHRFVGVREDHRTPGQEPENTLVAINPAGDDYGTVLARGHDFYAAPRVSPDGRHLLWMTWDHPAMPWDSTALWTAQINDDGSLSNPVLRAGGPTVSIASPTWSPDGVLTYVSDETGWWNIYRLETDGPRVLAPGEAEYARPLWSLNGSSYVYVDADRLLATCLKEGRSHVVWVDVKTGRIGEAANPYTQVSDPVLGARQVGLIGQSWDRLPTLVVLDCRTGLWSTVKESAPLPIPAEFLSRPEAIEFPTTGGRTAHAFYYSPHHPGFRGPEGERPPLIALSHGGPTSFSPAVLRLDIQYWTTRGFGVVDVNYGGSTGYGRPYRERLRGQWGVVDVDDVAAAARYLASDGRVDPARLAIRGGSAGGYTTMAALAFRTVFHAGVSYFGISDLTILARETHKFESRYLDSLIGPWPTSETLYRDRSPLFHVDRLAVPMLFFQGLLDAVVPPNQTARMVESLAARGIPVGYVSFPDEGHGFRRAENIRRAQEAELYFYGRVFGFEPADAVEPVTIQNLD